MPSLSWMTLATGATQLVVQLALLRIERLWASLVRSDSSFTPITLVGTPPPLAGAEMTTWAAPAERCPVAFSWEVKAPVLSITTLA